MRYMVVIEEGPTSFGAYVPDLPGCIAVGETSEEVLQLIQEAIEFHIEGLKEEGQCIPTPHSSSSFVDVPKEKTFMTHSPQLDVDDKEIYRFLTTQYLHQNQLSWSRLQTTFAVEAGLLAWFFTVKMIPSSLIVVGMILGSIAIWLLYQLVLRDWEIRDQNNKKLDQVHKPQQIKLLRGASRKWLKGRDIAAYLTFGSIIVNLVLSLLRLHDIA